jgi:MSHA biogenesis protein MshQ
MPLRTEYFDGTGYIVNTDDNCTSWSSLNASVDILTIMSLSFGDMTSGLSSPSGLLMLAPTSVIGLPDIGEATVIYDAESWLEGDYDNDGTYEDPQGVATFGLNRGHERIIFRKEVH